MHEQSLFLAPNTPWVGQLDVARILDQLLARRILVEIVDGILCPLPGRHVGPWQAADRMTDLDSDARKR